MARVGIKEIAALAGVSIATVSNAVRNPDRVSEATREKVLSLVKELGYVPNRFGVGLRTARSNNILVIIDNIASSFYHSMIQVIQNIAEDRGYSVLLADTQGSEEIEKKYAQFVVTGQADGVLLFSSHYPFDLDADQRALKDAPPVVSACENCKVQDIPLVSIDNVQAGKDATNHLIDYGHTNIAVMTGDMSVSSCQERLQGFRLAMEEAGIPVREDNIIYGSYSSAFGESAVQQLLSLKDRPTAVFCFNDDIALGCVHSLTKMSINVSSDISVMGFDNIPLLKYIKSPFTTIAQPQEQIAEIAMAMLLDKMAGKPVSAERVILKHELKVGISTRRLNEVRSPVQLTEQQGYIRFS